MGSNFICVLFWPETFFSMQKFNFNIVKGLCDIWLQCAKSFQNPKLIWSCKTKLQLCQQSYTSEIWNEVNFSYGTLLVQIETGENSLIVLFSLILKVSWIKFILHAPIMKSFCFISWIEASMQMLDMGLIRWISKKKICWYIILKECGIINASLEFHPRYFNDGPF